MKPTAERSSQAEPAENHVIFFQKGITIIIIKNTSAALLGECVKPIECWTKTRRVGAKKKKKKKNMNEIN